MPFFLAQSEPPGILEILVLVFFFVVPLLRRVFGGKDDEATRKAPRPRASRRVQRPDTEVEELDGAEIWKRLLRGESLEPRPKSSGASGPSDASEPRAGELQTGLPEGVQVRPAQAAPTLPMAPDLARMGPGPAAGSTEAPRKRKLPALPRSQPPPLFAPTENELEARPELSSTGEHIKRKSFRAIEQMQTGLARVASEDSIESGVLPETRRLVRAPDQKSARSVHAAGSPSLSRIQAAARGNPWAQAWILSEVLGPPVTMRGPDGGTGSPPGLR